jgi:hypothetical protein
MDIDTQSRGCYRMWCQGEGLACIDRSEEGLT